MTARQNAKIAGAALLWALMLGAAPLWAATPPAPNPDESRPERFNAVPADAGSPFGGMAISPTRLVLEGVRGGQVTLYNSSTATISYRVEMIDLAVDESGQYAVMPPENVPAWSAIPYLRYAPRQVTLAPGERQAIKIIARPGAGMAPGELRSHMRFSSIPLIAPATETNAPEKPSQTKSMAITVGMDFRVTIPILLRVGATAGGAKIDAVTFSGTEGQRTAQVTLLRTGTHSDYGSLRVLDARGTVIGQLRGVSVPAPLARRAFPVTLKSEAAAPAKVVFVEELSGMQDGATLAEFAIR